MVREFLMDGGKKINAISLLRSILKMESSTFFIIVVIQRCFDTEIMNDCAASFMYNTLLGRRVRSRRTKTNATHKAIRLTKKKALTCLSQRSLFSGQHLKIEGFPRGAIDN